MLSSKRHVSQAAFATFVEWFCLRNQQGSYQSFHQLLESQFGSARHSVRTFAVYPIASISNIGSITNPSNESIGNNTLTSSTSLYEYFGKLPAATDTKEDSPHQSQCHNWQWQQFHRTHFDNNINKHQSRLQHPATECMLNIRCGITALMRHRAQNVCHHRHSWHSLQQVTARSISTVVHQDSRTVNPESVDLEHLRGFAASVIEGDTLTSQIPGRRATILQSAAEGVQWVHDVTGLPWWLSIPLTTWLVRTTLLPFSLWQAKTVRTNYLVWREASGLTDKQLGEHQSTSSHTEQTQSYTMAKRSRTQLANFALLRTKMGAPHPAWILINPMIQLPVFVVLGATLRMMGGVGWPDMTTGGALWFQDLTQVALIPGTLFSEPQQPWALPMGYSGLILPFTLLGLTLTSLRLGFGAAGAPVPSAIATAPMPQDWIGRAIKVLPYVLYGLAGLNTWVAMQLPHAALMHWLGSATFTLSLQVALQQPGFRSAFNLPSPAELQASLSRAVNQRLQQLSEAGGTLGPGRGYAVSSLPDSVLKQVAGERNADVLVILGAQHSAQKRYREALYCLDRALQLDPAHVRGHYSRGQVFSLNNRWQEAEACFRQAAQLAVPGPSKGQALYCVATALHSQGKLESAVAAYTEALSMWQDQPVVAYSLANALIQLGRLAEAKELVSSWLGPTAERSNAAGPFHLPFVKLLEQIKKLQEEKQRNEF